MQKYQEANTIQAAAGIYSPEVTKPCPRASRSHCMEVLATVPPARSMHQLVSTPRKPGVSSWSPRFEYVEVSAQVLPACYLSLLPPGVLCASITLPLPCAVFPGDGIFAWHQLLCRLTFGFYKRKYLQIRGRKEKRVFPLHPTLAVVSAVSSQAASLPGFQALRHVP